MPKRLNDNECKTLIVKAAKLRKERDALNAGLPSADSIGSNPMELMGLMGKMGDFQKIIELSKEIESIAVQVEREFVLRLGVGHG